MKHKRVDEFYCVDSPEDAAITIEGEFYKVDSLADRQKEVRRVKRGLVLLRRKCASIYLAVQIFF
jgi:hypothetical protein